MTRERRVDYGWVSRRQVLQRVGAGSLLALAGPLGAVAQDTGAPPPAGAPQPGGLHVYAAVIRWGGIRC